ncbi:MAG TPA: NAD(P)/FAD-dependent oxidoreductase, partial [Nitrolancea sp.]|nr:NAD(P)/FAD-dependent oxidoreductase [Nitrolancea sp.]
MTPGGRSDAVLDDSGEGDEEFIRGVVAAADPNVLRIVLLQLGGAADLAAMEVEKVPIRAGAFFGDVLAERYHADVRDRAVAVLLRGSMALPTTPNERQTRVLMELLTGDALNDSEFQFGWEELAFQQFPRDPRWTTLPPVEALAGFHVVVVGAGISGLAAAIMLKRSGIPYTVFERQSDIGGTWHLNTYPEARVDVSSYVYQFKFTRNYPWPEYFASQGETIKYLRHVVDQYGIRDRIELDTEVTAARWDEAQSSRQLEVVNANSRRPISANVVVSASGLFSTANMPKCNGIEGYEGRLCHTTQWDHRYDISGKRVALISNGSGGSQLMPYLAQHAGELSVFQRTP